MAINLNQLRFFLEVARQNSFSKAAETCCVTQPTLSNAIAQLEDILEGKLFNRSTRRVSLTTFGKYLLPLAEAVLTAQNEFVEGARAFKNPQHKLLRIGLSPLVNMQLLTDVLEPFKKQHADLEVFFKECYLDDLSHRLEDETIDIAITPKRESHIQFVTFPLYSEPLYFLPCERDGEVETDQVQGAVLLGNISDVPIILTAGGCGLRDTVTALFHDEGLSLKEYTGQAVSYKAIEDWAGLGIGAGVLPKSKFSADNKSARQLFVNKETEATVEYEVSYSRHIEYAPHVKDFIEYLTEVAPQLIQGRAA